MVTTQAPWVEALSGPIEPVAYHDLEGRPAFKLALKESNGRYYLFLGHFWDRGWSIVDVTDPAQPRLVRFLPGPTNTWTLQVTVHGDLLATALEAAPEDWGGDPTQPFEEGVLLWDIHDPENPTRVGHVHVGRGTHRNGFDERGLLHLSAKIPGVDGYSLLVVDVSEPQNPQEVARFSMPDQFADSHSPNVVPFGIHGPSQRVGDIGYLPYGEYGLIVVDLSHPDGPQQIGRLNVRPPLGSRLSVHTALPLPGRDLVVVNSEALAENCAEPVNYAALVDVHDPAEPRMVSLFPTPEPYPGAAFTSYAEKGGRFGPHNQSMHLNNPAVLQTESVSFLTYFNAGLRVYDLREKTHVKEIAYVVPKDPERRFGPKPSTLVTQVEDVLVDSRGYVYFTEKNSGLYICKWNGPV